MSQPVSSTNRFNRPSNRCPICGGWERGNPQCKGYLADKPGVIFCTSSDYAGTLMRGDTGQFRHWTGPQGCKCGVSHLAANNYSAPQQKSDKVNMDNHKTVDETYDYGDGCFVDRILTGETQENGKPEKTFQQYQCQGKEKIFKGFKKLYPKPELRKWPGQFFIAEGERKVNKLMEMGFAAVCNVGGSGGWLDVYADEIPRDQTVFIWPDNDTATDKWVAKIVESLSRRGIKYHILSALNAGLPPKGDVMDWVKVPGNDAAKLMAELDKFKPQQLLWSLKSLSQFPKPAWLIEQTIKKNSLAFLVGPPKCGKSFYSLLLALIIASTGGRVVYIGAEDPGGFYERGMAWCHYYRIDPETLEGHLFFWVKPVAIHDDAQRNAFIQQVKEQFQPDIIFVDTLAMNSFGLDENSTKDMGIFVQALLELRNATTACIFTIHHTNRAGEYRGSSALPGAADTFMMAETVGDPLDKGGTLKIKCIYQRGFKPFDDKFFTAFPALDSLVLVANEEKANQSAAEFLSPSKKEVLKILAGPEGKNGMKVKEICDYAGWDTQDSKRKNSFRTMRELTEDGFCSLSYQGKLKVYAVTQKGRDVVEQGNLEFGEDVEF